MAKISVVGQISADGTGIQGHNGNLFVYKGSNGAIDLYSESTVPALWSKLWSDLLAQRVMLSNRSGMRYVQILIPEKSSVVPHLFPVQIKAPTKRYECLRDICKSALAGTSNFCDGLEIFNNCLTPDSLFLLLDAHLSTFGNCVLLNDYLTKQNVEFLACPTTYEVRKGRLGLGQRFSDDELGVQEEIWRIVREGFTGFSTGVPELVSKIDPPAGSHMGVTRVWKNDQAPIRLKVVCFGNSFFERGASSLNLSWWFARLYSEFHFIWSVNIDWSYCEAVKADKVICQTIERFITRVPTS